MHLLTIGTSHIHSLHLQLQMVLQWPILTVLFDIKEELAAGSTVHFQAIARDHIIIQFVLSHSVTTILTMITMICTQLSMHSQPSLITRIN